MRSEDDPAGPAVDLLGELCRQLAELVFWDRAVGDDAPRFGVMLQERAERVTGVAETLAREPVLAGDAELGQRVAELRAAATRSRMAIHYSREVVEAVHEVAERAEDLLGVTW